MNRKGQIGVGTILIVFITILVGVILFTAIAQQVGTATNLNTIANQTLGTASNATTVYLTNMRSISSVVIVNASGLVIGAGNYTVTNNVVYNGALAVSVLPTSPADGDLTGYEWEISGTSQPTTYIPGSGGRAVAGLITIFFAIAIVVVALTPTLSSKLLDAIGR